MDVLEVNVPSGPWSGPKARPWTLYAGDEQAFRIACEPSEAGEHGGVAEFVTDPPEVPTYQVAVEGSALEACEIYDAYLFNDNGGGDFWVDWSGERVLQPGDIFQVEVGYQWDMVSYDSASDSRDENVLHILSSDPDEQDLQLGLYDLGAT